MNVWREKAGTMVAQLAIFDPATRKDEQLRVRVDDEFAVGEERFRVVQIVPRRGTTSHTSMSCRPTELSAA